MARDKLNIMGKIIGSKGQVFQVETRTKTLLENKYFAAAVMCGHAGNGFFVPVILPVAANDKDRAVEIIKATPRVKNKSPKCVLGMTEISLCEYNFLNTINTQDPYLSHTQSPNETRKVLSQNYAEAITKKRHGEKLSTKDRIMLTNINNKPIRYAKDYPDSYVLQKAFSPTLVGGKIVYPSKVNMDKLLYDFYINSIRVLGLKSKKVYILRYCLQLFGLENELGVKLDTENNAITFVNQQGDIESLDITEVSKNIILTNQEYRVRDAIRKLQKPEVKISPEVESKIKLPSAVDKFNKRMAKTKQAQSTNTEIED